jgi:hypothetical protein
MGKGQYNKEWTTTNIAGLTVSLDMLVLWPSMFGI